MTLRSRGGYVAVTGVLAAVAAAAAFAGGRDAPVATAVGLGTAWALQAPSFWRLAAAVEHGRSATRDWLGGIALRLGGLALLAVVGGGPGWPRRELALSYVAALLVFLLLETVWLYRLQPAPGRQGGAAGGPDGDQGRLARPGGSPARPGGSLQPGDSRTDDDERRERGPGAGAPPTTAPRAR